MGFGDIHLCHGHAFDLCINRFAMGELQFIAGPRGDVGPKFIAA